MSEPLLRFPVVCPMCRREELAVLPTGYVAAALLKGSIIQLYASCHDVYWDARPIEVEQLREYLGIAAINVHQSAEPIAKNATESPFAIGALVGSLARKPEPIDAATDRHNGSAPCI